MAASTEDALAAQRPDQARALDAKWRARIDQRLEELLPATRGGPTCPQLAEAMRYSLLAPGKRVRPLLAIRTALHFDGNPNDMLDFGCALEMVHCASLMLDDLPCMDDAAMRRGRPACHHEYGDATTTLAAIALLNQAFGVLARADLGAELRCALVDHLSDAVGTSGLVSGQSRDLIERAGTLDGETVAEINHQKTGVLFELATAGAGCILGLPDDELDALQRYAGHLGQAFQAADDLLDARHLAEGSGKDASRDVAKAGSVHAVGVEVLEQRVSDELEQGEALLPEVRGPASVDGYVRDLFARFI